MSIFVKPSISITSGEHTKSCEFLLLGGWVGTIQESAKMMQGVTFS
jgi:hypothetical protein